MAIACMLAVSMSLPCESKKKNYAEYNLPFKFEIKKLSKKSQINYSWYKIM